MSYMCSKGYSKSLQDTFINLFNELSIHSLCLVDSKLIEYSLDL